MDTVETWPRSPEAASFFERRAEEFAADNTAVATMARRFRDVAGVNLLNLVDHWIFPETPELAAELSDLGLRAAVTEDGDAVWEHPTARLPRVRLEPNRTATRVTIGVDNIDAFFAVNPLLAMERHGDLESSYEEAIVPFAQGELGVIVRQGYKGFRREH